MIALDPINVDIIPADDLRAIRRENRLREERLKAADLERREKAADFRKVRETWQTDWFRPYVDLARDMRDGFGGAFGPATIWSRKQGRNYPIIKNEQDLALLRLPSRFLSQTNSYGIGFREGLKGYILGGGITYRASIKAGVELENSEDVVKAVQEVVDDFLEDNQWYGGEMPGVEEEAFDRSIEDGEFFLMNFPLNRGRLQVRFAEPEQCVMPPGKTLDEWSFGVRTDPSDVQNPLGYWIAWNENIVDGDEIPADRMTHFRRNAKRQQKRGVPEFSFDTYDQLDAASKLADNMGEAAAQQASIVGAMKFKTGTQSEIQAVATAANDYYKPDPYRDGQQVGVRKTRKGTWEYLPDSQEYTSGPAATNAEAHSAVLQMLLRAACVRWNMPEWFGSADASQTNRANGMTAERNSINRIIREQKRYAATFRSVVKAAVEHMCRYMGDIGGLSVDQLWKVVNIQATAPAPVTPDPLIAAQVAAIEIPLKVDSRQNYMQEQGRDPKQIEADNDEWDAAHADEIMLNAGFPPDGGKDGNGGSSQAGDTSGGDQG